MIVTTILGPMDDSLLEKRESATEDENARIEVVEYWLDGVCVHRSPHIKFKRVPSLAGALQSIG